MFRKTLLLILVLVLALSAWISVRGRVATTDSGMSPGVVFEVETTYYRESKKIPLEILVEGRSSILPYVSKKVQYYDRISTGKRHTDVEYESGGKSIFRELGGKGAFVFLSERTRQYQVIDIDVFRNIAGRRAADAAMLQQAIKSLPKEQREALERAERARRESGAVAAKEIPKREIKKTKESAVKAGYPCVKYEVYEDGSKIREIWVTQWSKIDGGDEAEKAFAARSAFVTSVGREFPGNEDYLSPSPPFDIRDFDNGFPVVVKSFAKDGSVDNETRLRKTRRQPIDPMKFEPASGHKRVSGSTEFMRPVTVDPHIPLFRD